MKSLAVFQKRLREARRQKNMSQKDLALKAGLTAATISACEKGTKNPSLASVIEIANVLNVSVDWLCGESSASSYGCDYINQDSISASELFGMLNFLAQKAGPEIKIESYEDVDYNPISEKMVPVSMDRIYFVWERPHEIVDFLKGLSQLIELRKKDILSEDLFQASVNGIIAKYPGKFKLGDLDHVATYSFTSEDFEEVEDSLMPF